MTHHQSSRRSRLRKRRAELRKGNAHPGDAELLAEARAEATRALRRHQIIGIPDPKGSATL